MASNEDFKDLKDLDLSQDEMQRLSKAFKNEEFRKLFREYAEEISDPENRRKYEEEITQMERDRGVDVKFIHPHPGYVMKTSVNGEQKAFINISSNDLVAKPSMQRAEKQGNDGNVKKGMNWAIPYSLSPPRDDLDKAGNRCVVFDCVFNPDTIRMAEKNQRFRTMINDTALDGIEKQFEVKFDRNNTKFPKMKYKGKPSASVIRIPKPEGPTGVEDGFQALDVPYPFSDDPANKGQDSDKGKDSNTQTSGTNISGNRNSETTEKEDAVTKPKYTIVHRGHFDIQNFRNAPDAAPTTRPQELVVNIQLPLLKSAKTVNLDIYEQSMVMECVEPVAYKLDVKLPYKVNENQGGAKFDKAKRCLTVTLPVLPPEIPDLPSFSPEEEKKLVEELNPADSVSEDTSEVTRSMEKDSTDKVMSEEKQPRQQANNPGTQEYQEVIATEDSLMPKYITESNKTNENEDRDADDENSDNARETAKDAKEHNQEPKVAMLNEGDRTMTEKTKIYEMPDFSYRQDTDTVTFILHHCNLKPESVKKEILCGLSGIHVTMETRSEGEDVKNYSFCVQFLPNYNISPDVAFDVLKDRAVMVIQKMTFKGNWSTFKVGRDLKTLQEKSFLSAASLQSTINTIVQRTLEDSNKVQEQCMKLEVTESTDDKLVIQLEPTTGGGDSKSVHSASTASRKDVPDGNNSTETEKTSTSQVRADRDQNDVNEMATAAAASTDPTPRSSVDKSSCESSTDPVRSPRPKITKSVSFNETVVVENFKERSKKAQKKKPGKVEMSFRTKERLKDSSEEDSESPNSPCSPQPFNDDKSNNPSSPRKGSKNKGFFKDCKNEKSEEKGPRKGKEEISKTGDSTSTGHGDAAGWNSHKSKSESELHTKSAVAFSNTLMYDLD
ncbi:protein kintoun-like [Glandiceps talaboti]